jgi:hypothetical protein
VVPVWHPHLLLLLLLLLLGKRVRPPQLMRLGHPQLV